jgi:hypothetical protein
MWFKSVLEAVFVPMYQVFVLSVCGFVGVNNAEAPFNTVTLWEI